MREVLCAPALRVRGMLPAMLEILAQGSSSSPNAAAGGILALIGGLGCFAVAIGLGHTVIFLLALIQILSRAMPTDAKLLWVVLCLLLPFIGPILWWVIGSKQYPSGR